MCYTYVDLLKKFIKPLLKSEVWGYYYVDPRLLPRATSHGVLQDLEVGQISVFGFWPSKSCKPGLWNSLTLELSLWRQIGTYSVGCVTRGNIFYVIYYY